MGEIILATDRDVALAKRTVAADLTTAEFDLFAHMCRRSRLDPLRRQIYAIVISKDKPDKRRVVYVTAIDGYRTIAERTGNYRPGQRSVVVDEAAIDPVTNPQGIISATASVWKFTHGEWHEFSETVHWEEFAPLKEIWAYNPDLNKKVPTGKFELDRSGNWPRMGRVMLSKCAEGQCLRRGWPDEYGDLYFFEEMDQARVLDITPSAQAERAGVQERQAKLGGPSILIDWMDGNPLASVSVEKLHGRVRDFIKSSADAPMTICAFADRNKEALRQFWGVKPDEALDLKKAFETYQKTAANMEMA